MYKLLFINFLIIDETKPTTVLNNVSINVSSVSTPVHTPEGNNRLSDTKSITDCEQKTSVLDQQQKTNTYEKPASLQVKGGDVPPVTIKTECDEHCAIKTECNDASGCTTTNGDETQNMTNEVTEIKSEKDSGNSANLDTCNGEKQEKSDASSMATDSERIQTVENETINQNVSVENTKQQFESGSNLGSSVKVNDESCSSYFPNNDVCNEVEIGASEEVEVSDNTSEDSDDENNQENSCQDANSSKVERPAQNAVAEVKKEVGTSPSNTSNSTVASTIPNPSARLICIS